MECGGNGLNPMNHPQSPTQLLLYQTEDGQTRIQLRTLDGSIWLSQKEIANLFGYGVKSHRGTQFEAMHWAAHGHTAAEVIALRANASAPCKRIRSRKIHNRRLIWEH